MSESPAASTSWFGRLTLTIARFCLSAWVGAAALFVVNGIRLATAPQFDATARNHFAAIRFPSYYLFGFALVAAAAASLFAARRGTALSRTRLLLAAGLATLSAVVMLGDYLLVYLPLQEMITPASAPRPARFVQLHRISEWINVTHVGFAFLASLLANWPLRGEAPR